MMDVNGSRVKAVFSRLLTDKEALKYTFPWVSRWNFGTGDEAGVVDGVVDGLGEEKLGNPGAGDDDGK